MEGTEQVRAAAAVTTTWRKVRPPKCAPAPPQPGHVSLHLPRRRVRREGMSQRDGIGAGSAHLSPRWPRRGALLSKAFPVLSNYNTKKEMHLTCK